MLRRSSNLLVGALLVLIAGCGFHLRGTADLAENLKTMYIQGINLQRDLGLSLKRGLSYNDVNVVKEYQSGTAVLTILDNKFERRILSVGADAKVSEYQLYSSLVYKLTDSANQVVIESEKLEAVRDYQFDQNQVLASDQQESQLRLELNEQLVQSLLRRLSAIQ